MFHRYGLLINLIIDSFSNIYEMSSEVQGLIPYYQVIKEVNIARNNLLETRQYFENMMAIPSRVCYNRTYYDILRIHMAVDRSNKLESYYQMTSTCYKFILKYESSKRCAIKPYIK